MLHTDTVKEFYPSEHQLDLTWETLTHATSGEPPTPRARGSLSPFGGSLLAFGGVSSYNGQSHNDTREFSLSRRVWQPVAVSSNSGPILERSDHTAVVCSLAVGCATRDSRPILAVFGGWGLRDCGHPRPCYRHNNELWQLDLNNMTWSRMPVNAEQPKPYKRKGHTANLVNGSHMVIFGGSAWTPDKDADNSYGATTKQANDVWRIDLSGADGYTWHAVHTAGDAPTPREGHASAVIDDRWIVIHGGHRFVEGAQIPSDGMLAAPAQRQNAPHECFIWHTLARCAYPGTSSRRPTTTGEHGYLGDVHVLDTWTDPMMWTRPVLTGAAPAPRVGHEAAVLDGLVFTWGGMSNSGFMCAPVAGRVPVPVAHASRVASGTTCTSFASATSCARRAQSSLTRATPADRSRRDHNHSRY